MTSKQPLSITHPAVALMANGWDPSTTTAGSRKIGEWKCKLDHVWTTEVQFIIKSSLNKDKGCPYCSGRRPIIGQTDLKTTHPEISSQAHNWDTTTVTAGSHEIHEWKCGLGHIWVAPVSAITRGGKCAVCRGLQINVGYNDLLTTHPESAKHAYGWNPETVTFGSREAREWRCDFGHVWSAVVSSKVRSEKTGNSGCPYCARKIPVVGETDLATTHPDIAKQSLGWNPETVTSGSSERREWKCNEGHIWKTSPNSRTKHDPPTNCPFCSNNKVSVGFNDLSRSHPTIAKSAFGWDPTLLTFGSTKILEWKCKRGHIWSASVNNRTKGHNCPFCTRRRVLTGYNDLSTTHPHIAKLAHGFDPTTVTHGSPKRCEWVCGQGHIWISAVSTVVASEGNCAVCSGHQIQIGFNDLSTTNPLSSGHAHGWDPTTVTAGSNKKSEWICGLGHVWSAVIASKIKAEISGNTGCPYCSNRKVIVGFNDLCTTHPDMAKQSYGWNPKMVTAGINKKREWICGLGHVWSAVVNSRTRNNSGCPYCENQKLLVGFNDLLTVRPEIGSQANGWDPTTELFGSSHRREWRCKPHGHIWTASVSKRTWNNSGCPFCSNKKILVGFNDLLTTNQLLAAQAFGWDPRTVTAGSDKRLEWMCDVGHVWKARVADRATKFKRPTDCPMCVEYGFDINKNAHLYFMKHELRRHKMVGISNTVDRRAHTHFNAGWSLINLSKEMTGQEAVDLEDNIRFALKNLEWK